MLEYETGFGIGGGGMLIGYARVSKDEQNLDLQIDALNAAGVERIFSDRESGARADRKGLAETLSHLRAGDVLTVWKLDRLGRNTIQLMLLLNQLHERGVEFKSLTEGIDTTTAFGRFFFTMSAALSQLERDRLIERTKAGLKSAKARGRTGGRKPKLTSEQIEMAKGLLASGKAPRDVAKAFGVGRSTLYRYVPGDTSTADDGSVHYRDSGIR
jgi:DNA invertase Pin-like site-specific DNA recombinase